jgi:CO/xanthine dehydrogenase Mo-binding subunit
MTEILNKELSRKTFLKGGGALVVGFSLGAAGRTGQAHAAESPYASHGGVNMNRVDAWIRIHADNTASILTGRIELGQGTSVGMLQIAGEELDLEFSQLKFVVHDTNVTPNTGHNAASASIRDVGQMVRGAAATARQALLGLAATSLGVPAASLTVKAGVVSGGGRSVTYGELLGDRLFNVQLPASYGMTDAAVAGKTAPGLQTGMPGAKPVSQYTLVGQRIPRLDIPDKVSGKLVYVNHIRVPGMLHARVVRPRGQGAYGDGTNPQIVSVDESSIRHIPGARVVRKGNLLAVVAPAEYDAVQAASQLKVTWADPPPIVSSGNMWKQMRELDSAGRAPARQNGSITLGYQPSYGNPDAALGSAAKTFSGTFKYHYQHHAVIGPSCVVAEVTPNGALVFTSSQDIYGVRGRLAPLLGLPLNQIRVKYYESASAFGGSPGRYDAPLTAAVISQVVGKPVRLQFMRWDEHGWANYGPATMVDIRGGVDASGKLVALDYTGFQIPGSGAWPAEQMVGMPLPTPGLGSPHNQGAVGSAYAIPNVRVTAKSLPLVNNYFKNQPLRSPGGPQAAFAFEQMIDGLAHASGIDPLQFRVQNVTTMTDPATPWFHGERWLGVLNAVTKAANWQPRVAASNLTRDTVVTGRGLAVGPHGTSIAAVVADIEVNKKTGKIIAKHVYAAEDHGLTINPGMVENQIVGTVVQATSRVLHEATPFNTKRVTGLDWVSYPILRFAETPKVTALVVQRPDKWPRGSGEIPTPGTVGAIANAFFDATGVRIYEAPMTPARVRATLKAAGIV